MKCVLVSELPDMLLGILILINFFAKRNNPILYRKPYALTLGLFFLTASVLEAVLDIALDPLEFLGFLGIMLLVEKFISANTDERIHYGHFVLTVVLTLLTVFASRDPKCFRAGILLALAIITLNLRKNAFLLGEDNKDTLLLSSVFALLGIGAVLGGFEILSAFLYLGAVLLLFLTIAERVWGRC
ncbi:MAG: hypothetical protein J7K48_03300 [Thermococcus sp.]|nr:hypothetical protein [Thermococcus sp.]